MNLDAIIVGKNNMSKRIIESANLLLNQTNNDEPLVTIDVLSDESSVKTVAINYSPNYCSENGMISYEWTKEELEAILKKL
jgi:hypothetical protein